MKVEDLIICPLTQTVYIIEPNTKEEDIYKGYVATIPEYLLGRTIRCMYAAYNKKAKLPVLIVNL